jgi:hypothetical protein
MRTRSRPSCARRCKACWPWLRRAAEHLQAEQQEFEAKQAKHQAQREADKKPRRKDPEPPQADPKDIDQVNRTDEQSRIMPVSGGGFEESYNAQAGP